MFMTQALKMDTGFGALLGIDHAAVGEGIATELLPDGHAHPRFVATCNDGKGLLLHYPILPGLCTTPSSRFSASVTTADSPSMPRAVLLAVFDHASTYSMAVADKWARPGVSINLAMEFSPEAHRIMVPGAVLAMECNSTKIGRVAGFAECKVSSEGILWGHFVRTHFDVPTLRLHMLRDHTDGSIAAIIHYECTPYSLFAVVPVTVPFCYGGI